MEKFENKLHDFDTVEILINLYRYTLNQKSYIKKYNRLRKLHSEILDSMLNYMYKGKYDTNMYFDKLSNTIYSETNYASYTLNKADEDDENILTELFVYKNHNMIPSVTEVYLEKNILRSEEKKKLLNSMNNSYVGLFKITDVDKTKGYVFYEDVFTHKDFKVIDISISITLQIDVEKPTYVYNRIITYEDISFGTGIHCMFRPDNKQIDEFIKNHSYCNCSDFSRCLMLYKLSKSDKHLKIKYNDFY